MVYFINTAELATPTDISKRNNQPMILNGVLVNIQTIERIQPAPVLLYGKTLDFSIENYSTGWTISLKSPFTNKLLSLKEDGEFTIK